ncbi:MAG: hypothetical protein QOJ84_2615, partial [Bradyrhizobium sp.]|nr:hypothetical protein [Bradyrhizobium sp.]
MNRQQHLPVHSVSRKETGCKPAQYRPAQLDLRGEFCHP